MIKINIRKYNKMHLKYKKKNNNNKVNLVKVTTSCVFLYFCHSHKLTELLIRCHYYYKHKYTIYIHIHTYLHTDTFVYKRGLTKKLLLNVGYTVVDNTNIQ